MSARRLGEEVLAGRHGTGDDPQLFAIADAAQNRALPDAVNTGTSACLLEVGPKSDLARNAPHLVALPSFDPEHESWRWILRNGPRRPCVTVIGATIGFAALLRSLRALAEVKLPDGDEMFFAFWDPAILGSLVGQPDDTTLHVGGPILTEEQKTSLLHGITGWWYWDRAGSLHTIDVSRVTGAETRVPFKLLQTQVDDLVEASVPDHIRYHIELNQPQLFEGMPDVQRYAFVQRSLAAGRAIGLEGMGDLVNYACACLIYRDRLERDPIIATLLGRVKRGMIDFDTAMKEFP